MEEVKMKKGDLLKALFPTLEIHKQTTVANKLKKISEARTELLDATDIYNFVDENIDHIRSSVALLIDFCEKKGIDLTEALERNDDKVFKKYPLAVIDIE